MSGLFAPFADASLRIIDLSAGNRAIWFEKNLPFVVHVDIRPSMKADVVCDTARLPFRDDAFDLAVFDPPHTNVGPNSDMARRYGHSTSAQIREIIRGSSCEAARCVRRDGLLALKWNDHSIKLTSVLGLMPEWVPLFGHHVAQRISHPSSTSWLMMLNSGRA